jgi:hypothetical protein
MARHALLIGVSEFTDERLARLNAPTNDVIALRGILQDSSRGNFDSVEMSLDEDFLAVRDHLSSFFHDRSPDDVLLLYYSGHGILGRGNRLFLATSGSNLDTPRTRSVGAQEIRDFIEDSRAQRQIVVLDCCHSGAFSEHAKSAVPPPAVTSNTFSGADAGLYVLTAADSLQFAWDGPELRTGDQTAKGASQFTSWLVEGLEKGEAAPEDEQITMDALYRYASRRARSEGAVASPQRFVQGGVGDLIISANPLMGSSQIDPEVIGALAVAEVRTRLGAITELALQIDEGHTVAARAARLILQRHLQRERDYQVRRAITKVLAEEVKQAASAPRLPTHKETRQTEEKRRVEAASKKNLRTEHSSQPPPPTPDELSSHPSRRAQILLSIVGLGLALVGFALAPDQYSYNQSLCVIASLIWATVASVTFFTVRSDQELPAYLLVGLNALLFALALIFSMQHGIFVLFALVSAIESAAIGLHVWRSMSPDWSFRDQLFPDPSRRTPIILSILGGLLASLALLLSPGTRSVDQAVIMIAALVWLFAGAATLVAVRSKRIRPVCLVGILNLLLFFLSFFMKGGAPGIFVLFALSSAIESAAVITSVRSHRSIGRSQLDIRPNHVDPN